MRLFQAAQLVPAERGQAAAIGVGEIVADHQWQIERFGDALDPANQIDRRADDGEIEPVGGADIAIDCGADVKRYDDLDIGSYPAFRNGKPSVSLVLRGTDDARLAKAAVELMDTIRKMNGEAEEFAQ